VSGTGGAVGPEASVLSVAIIALTFVAFDRVYRSPKKSIPGGNTSAEAIPHHHANDLFFPTRTVILRLVECNLSTMSVIVPSLISMARC